MYGRDELVEVLRRAKTLVSSERNKFGWWGGWNDADDTIREIDFKISLIETQPEPDPFVVADLFVTTGPMLDLSIANGWTDEFDNLAEQFASIAQQIRRNRKPICLQQSQPGAAPSPFSPGGGARPVDKLVVDYTPEHGTEPHNRAGSRRGE
jgi:hypothetical protein